MNVPSTFFKSIIECACNMEIQPLNTKISEKAKEPDGWLEVSSDEKPEPVLLPVSGADLDPMCQRV